MAGITFMVGGYAHKGTPGIYRARLSETGSLVDIAPVSKEAQNPSWLLLHPNGEILYTVEENDPDGSVAVFRIKGKDLDLRQRFPAGASPCHLAMDDTASLLAVSNYMDGTLDLFSLNRDGTIKEKTDHIQHTGHGPNPQRQEGPHMHSALFHKGKLFASDLGLDRVFVYDVAENGRLISDGWIQFPAGCGPRHMAIHPGLQDILFVNAEMGGNVFAADLADRSVISGIQIAPEELKGSFGLSSVKFCGDTLYVGSRGWDAVAMLELNEDGRLSPPVIHAHAQKAPRDIWMDEKWCMTADVDSESVTLDERNGMTLKQRSTVRIPGLKPACVIQLKNE